MFTPSAVLQKIVQSCKPPSVPFNDIAAINYSEYELSPGQPGSPGRCHRSENCAGEKPGFHSWRNKCGWRLMATVTRTALGAILANIFRANNKIIAGVWAAAVACPRLRAVQRL